MWFENKKPILALAPMADMTDGPFCNICREVAEGHPELVSGSDTGKMLKRVQHDKKNSFVIFREMVSAEAIVRGNEKTLKMCEFKKQERPIVQQIFGPEPEVIEEAAKIIVKKFKPDGIDINMGCPVPKLTKKVASGAALMKDHKRAAAIVKALKNANLGVPVSVKTRLGWGSEDEILEFAPKLEEAGADLISIHGRTKQQGYSGSANWDIIGRVKKLLTMPVIANGDIKSREDVKKCLEVTGADGVMIGRGALGNPWIFLHSNYECPECTNCEIDLNERINTVLRHAELHLKHYGKENGLRTFRKHLVWYFKTDRVGEVPGIKKFRAKLVKVNDLEELESLLREF